MAGAGMKDIKRRIRSVESTMQITKAMELVASSKLRKAKERVERTRPLFEIVTNTISDIAYRNTDFSSIYLKGRPVKSSGFIIIAGDRGLAGGYNSNLLRYAAGLMEGKNAKIIPIGKKVVEYFSRRDYEIIQHPYTVVEDITISNTFALGRMVADLFKKKVIDELFIVYTNFVSVLTQDAAHVRALPITAERGKAKGPQVQIVYDPSPGDIFEAIVPQYIGCMINGAVSESFASEQGARRTAMESASDNATEVIDHLNLIYNRARQSTITQEITEIVSGAQALE